MTRILILICLMVVLAGCSFKTDNEPDYKDGNLQVWHETIDGVDCVFASRGKINIAIDCNWP